MTDLARPRRVLPVIVLSQFTGTSLWFAGNALLPDLVRAFGLGDGALAAVTSAVQLGFIAGTLVFALLNVADRFSARHVFLVCSVGGACANAGIVWLPAGPGAEQALLALRFATGVFLAGVYPVGMKIAASWYREGLGGALGFLVGALVVGTALPHLVRGVGDGLRWDDVALSLSALAIAGGVLMVLLVPEGPHLSRATRFSPGAVIEAFRSPAFRASSCGYFGHMWELYTFWAFVPVLLAAQAQLHGAALDVSVASFAVIAAGALGCVGGGLLSRRVGSARVAFTQLSLSGLCCLLSPLAFLLPPAAFLGFLIFWGVVVVGDSPQFSALNAATAPPQFVGSALTIVNCIGFSITVVSIYMTAWLARSLPVDAWFVAVAAGPAAGLWAMRRIVRRPASSS